MIVLAKSCKGSEFLYSYQSAHKVPKNRVDEICKVLNEVKFQLKENEVWHKHEVGCYDNAYVFAETQEFKFYRGKLREVRR